MKSVINQLGRNINYCLHLNCRNITNYCSIQYANIEDHLKLYQFNDLTKHFSGGIFDVRSPVEYEEDHLPGAVNLPILTNSERSVVGTIYHKDNPDTAKLVGSRMIMNNLISYLEPGGLLYNVHQSNKRNENILIYCWRGGQRSRSVAIVLSELWSSNTVFCLNGGYKTYRRMIYDHLSHHVPLNGQINMVGLTGLTGSGKSAILKSLHNSWSQPTLDLEHLANHKGSSFGSNDFGLTQQKQPSQKRFESLIWQRLNEIIARQINDEKKCDKYVWVECESKCIGQLHLPSLLWQHMQHKLYSIVILHVPQHERVKHILSQYHPWTNTDVGILQTLQVIDRLSKYQSKALVAYWKLLVTQSRFEEFVESILTNFYDPLYVKTQKQFLNNYKHDSHSNYSMKIYDIDVASLHPDVINNEICSQLIEEIINKTNCNAAINKSLTC